MSVTQDLLANYQHVIEDLRLVTGGQGIFDVKANGELIYSKHETGRHAMEGEVLELFADHIGPTVRRYGT